MKPLATLSLVLLCFFSSVVGLAQVSPHQISDILHEKVRDNETRSALLEALRLPDLYAHEASRSTEIEAGAEPSIAIDPNDPSHMAIAFMDPNLDFPIYWSNDGGFVWHESDFDCLAAAQSATGGDVLGGGDPVLEFTPDGKLHLTWIYLLGTFADAEFTVYYAVSDDFGATFEASTDNGMIVHSGDLIDFDLIDRQWLAADHSGGDFHGNLYMSGAYFGSSITNAGEIVMVKTPTDNAFGNATTTYTGSGTQYGNVEVDGDGNVHVSMFSFSSVDDQTQGEVVHCVSNDGAQTWTCSTVDPNIVHPSNGGASEVHGRENPAVSMAVDGSKAYMTWTSFPETGVEAYFAYSHDNGANWSVPVAFGDEILGDGFTHFMPVVCADNGKVTLSWYGIDNSSDQAEYYTAESQDLGLSFGEAFVVSNGATAFADFGALDFFGDYNSAVKYGCESYHAWSDGHEGAPRMYVVKYNGCDNTLGMLDISPVNAGWGIQNLYPNPVQDALNVTLFGNPGTVQYSITSAKGELVQKGQLASMQQGIDTSDFAPGVYVLVVQDTHGVAAQRSFVKH